MKRFIFLMLIGIVGIYLGGCEIEPAKPENTLELNETVKQIASFGWNTNRIVTSSSEIAEVTNISQSVQNEGSEEIPGIGTLKKHAVQFLSKTRVECSAHSSLMKTNGDSLLFFEDNTLLGIRKALYYDADNGMARYYEAKYKFASWQNLTYDSTEIRVDLNKTLLNPFDDVLKSLYQQQLFKENFFIQKITNDLHVTDFESNEITGVEVLKDTYYRSDWFVTHMKQFIGLYPNKSGEIREDFDYKDGKTSYKHVTFYPDNTGEFEEQKRDGTKVSGEFDSWEDDGIGSYQELTDFPDGRLIDTIVKSAHLSLSLPDSILTLGFSETITYSSGKTITDSARVVTHEQSDIKYTTLSYYKHNGEHGTFDIVEDKGSSTVNGNWTTADNYYILLTAEYYVDDSGHLHVEVYTSEADYNNGDNPIIVADYYFSPDGSGSGTLTYQGEKYNITFNDTGNTEFELDGKSATANVYE